MSRKIVGLGVQDVAGRVLTSGISNLAIRLRLQIGAIASASPKCGCLNVGA